MKPVLLNFNWMASQIFFFLFLDREPRSYLNNLQRDEKETENAKKDVLANCLLEKCSRSCKMCGIFDGSKSKEIWFGGRRRGRIMQGYILGKLNKNHLENGKKGWVFRRQRGDKKAEKSKPPFFHICPHLRYEKPEPRLLFINPNFHKRTVNRTNSQENGYRRERFIPRSNIFIFILIPHYVPSFR